MNCMNLIVAESDFGIVEDFTITFDEGSTDGDTECFDVSIFSNSAFEKTENFSLRIVAVEENVHLHIDELTITILDDDCK